MGMSLRTCAASREFLAKLSVLPARDVDRVIVDLVLVHKIILHQNNYLQCNIKFQDIFHTSFFGPRNYFDHFLEMRNDKEALYHWISNDQLIIF